ncbi:ATP-grasp domain-containing protein [Ureibacillus composti]|nr:ATP-grasp domain-containing protein [Ureibacillus composti]
MAKQDFIPVILGTDVNAYGMARSFHMAYGIESRCVGQGKLFMTDQSSFITIKVIENFMEPTIFLQGLIDYAKELTQEATKLILVASSDGYAELAIRHKEQLSEYYEMPFVDEKWIDELLYKDRFYDLCEKYGLDYPATYIVSKEQHTNVELPFDYPIALKPADSVAYLEAEFEGKQKAYIIKDQASFEQTLQNIYNSTYTGKMIVQDFIPGDDSNMRVLNAYCGRDGKVRMMCLGRPLLEDCTPSLIGNYVAIVNEYNEDIYKQFQQFLENIGYTGFANFDMKYDARDGKYKVFEINLRQGRSSFFTTGSGYNIAQYAAEDLVYGKKEPVVYAKTEHLWLGVPKEVALNYTEDQEAVEYMRKLIAENRYCTTLNYDQDKSIKRSWNVRKYYKNYEERYEKYFTKKGDK